MSFHGNVGVAQWATASALLICFSIAPSVGNAASAPATDTLQAMAMKVSDVVTDDQEDDVSAFVSTDLYKNRLTISLAVLGGIAGVAGVAALVKRHPR